MSKLIITLLAILFIAPVYSQTKKIKRPKSRVDISSVDSFVSESFNLYDKVYMYDGYAASGKPLEDEDIDVLEEALENVSALSADAPDILSDLDGEGALKQAKAVLQINRAKKALNYSIQISKELLLGSRQNEEPIEDTAADENNGSDSENNSSSGDNSSLENTTATPTFKVNSKFDFVPGNELIFFEDFSTDFIGDFPSKWNTNGSGEVVTINDNPQRWFEIKSGYGIYYIPNITALPEEYTLEFDVLASGINNKTSGSPSLQVEIVDQATFKRTEYSAEVTLPFGQYAPIGIQAMNFLKGKGRTINSKVQADIRDAVKNRPHVSIAVNKERLRLWVNETKYVDIPKLVPTGNKLQAIRFHSKGFQDGKAAVFITNIKVAKGGLDLRNTLMSTGKVSTNGILFGSGSAVIQPQSYGIIRQISQVLQQDKSMKLKIIGHTDSDGGDGDNITLSRKRAQAVKTALEQTYSISGNRLTADGKGESEPVAENNSPDGKAKNRRVEFIKQ